MDKKILKIKLKAQLKSLTWRAITTVILTLVAVATVWVYAAFTEPTAGPNDSDQDFAQNILGNNDANNDFISDQVASNATGSIIERQQYLQTQINTNLDATVSSRLAAASYVTERGTDNAALASNYTATRAGYLDNLNATVSSRALDSEVGDASDAASMSTTLFAGQQAIFDQTKGTTAYLTLTTRNASHNCDNTPSTCCASGYHLCFPSELYGAKIQLSGTDRHTAPGNVYGDVQTNTNTSDTDCNGWTGDPSGTTGWLRASCKLVIGGVQCSYYGMDGYACYSNRYQSQWCCFN